jgi:hypothetical protein
LRLFGKLRFFFLFTEPSFAKRRKGVREEKGSGYLVVSM